MKRLWIAAAIIILLAAACWISNKDVQRSCGQLLDTLSAAQQAVEADDIPLALEKTQLLLEQWDHWLPIGTMYIHHEDLEPIQRLFLSMDEYLKNGYPVSYLAASQQAAGILEHIIQSELPSFSNLL